MAGGTGKEWALAGAMASSILSARRHHGKIAVVSRSRESFEKLVDLTLTHVLLAGGTVNQTLKDRFVWIDPSEK